MSKPQPIDIFASNTEEFIGADALAKRAQEKGAPLNVKFGVDPTRPDLTFGHMVVFNKLKQFQQLGHNAILLIGNFTTLIGDPSGRSSTRPVLTKEDIAHNAQTYLQQAFKILDQSKTTVVWNADWFNKMSFEDCLKLARETTVARMLEREDFNKRYKEGTPISLIEFLYPLLQGFDSVEIEADVELGGSDQLFNMLMGRQLQKVNGQFEQAVITMPLLVGLDGEKKMSKSLGNYIAFGDSARDMFGKLMSIPDSVLPEYYRLLLLASEEELAALKTAHPMEAKKELARRLITHFHNAEAAAAERTHFETVFSKRELPTNIPEFEWASIPGGAGMQTNLIDVLAHVGEASGAFKSKKDIRRMVEQGAVKLEGETKLADPLAPIPGATSGCTLQAGKRFFCKLV